MKILLFNSTIFELMKTCKQQKLLNIGSYFLSRIMSKNTLGENTLRFGNGEMQKMQKNVQLAQGARA